MSEYLSNRLGGNNVGELSPLLRNYLTTVQLPSLGQSLTPRNEAELRLLAEALDALLAGNVTLTADLLIQQFKAIEMAQIDKNWKLARHLQSVPTGRITSLPEGEMEELLRVEEREKRRKVLESKMLGNWTKH